MVVGLSVVWISRWILRGRGRSVVKDFVVVGLGGVDLKVVGSWWWLGSMVWISRWISRGSGCSVVRNLVVVGSR